MHRNKFMCMGLKTIEDYLDQYKFMVQLVENWRRDGIKILDDGGIEDDYTTFYTYDPVVAGRYGFELVVEQNLGDLTKYIVQFVY